MGVIRKPKSRSPRTAEPRREAARGAREVRRFGAELKKNVFGKDLVEKGFWGKGGAQMVGNLASSGAARSAAAFSSTRARRLRLRRGAHAPADHSEQDARGDARFADSVRDGTSDATGISKDKILAAAGRTSRSPATWTALRQLATRGRRSRRRRLEVEDIAKTAAALKQQPEDRPEQMEAFSRARGPGQGGRDRAQGPRVAAVVDRAAVGACSRAAAACRGSRARRERCRSSSAASAATRARPSPVCSRC
jgi:hypothetical protein